MLLYKKNRRSGEGGGGTPKSILAWLTFWMICVHQLNPIKTDLGQAAQQERLSAACLYSRVL